MSQIVSTGLVCQQLGREAGLHCSILEGPTTDVHIGQSYLALSVMNRKARARLLMAAVDLDTRKA